MNIELDTTDFAHVAALRAAFPQHSFSAGDHTSSTEDDESLDMIAEFYSVQNRLAELWGEVD